MRDPDRWIRRVARGHERTVSGLFGALSYDDGQTWPVERLITDDGPRRELAGGATPAPVPPGGAAREKP